MDINENFLEIGDCRLGKIFHQKSGESIDSAYFLIKQKNGFVENAFSYNRNETTVNVGLAFGNEKFGLLKEIEKHIIEYSDFETIEEMISIIVKVLSFGHENNKYQPEDKIRIEHGKYVVVLAIDNELDLLLISSFSKKAMIEKKRTSLEQKIKVEEISKRHPNLFIQEGTHVPETTSISNIQTD